MSASGDRVAGRYRLASEIGSGGMGRVWLARDEMLHRDVAIKEVVLPPDLSDPEREAIHERTLREGRAAGRLSHPNVVAIYDVIQAEGRPWIVMELVRSRSLYQVIHEEGPVSPRRAAEIGLAVLAALRAAHQAGVWHRDVKPGNVLLAEDGRVVLSDFGLATYDGDGAVTRSGLILGSAQYISPERARDGASGPESDMWSLGATLYSAVEGRSPFARESSMATLTALATQPPDAPRRAGPLRPVLIGLLRKNPRHRMRAAEAERMLRQVAAGGVVSSRRAGLLAPRQRDSRDGEPTSVGAPSSDANGGTAPKNGTGALPMPVVGRVEYRRSRFYSGSPMAKVNTHTEETYGYSPPDRRRRWPWVVAALVVAVPGTLLGWNLLRGPAAPTDQPSLPPLSAPVLTAAMGVQACLAQVPTNESLITDSTLRPGEYAMLPSWTYFHDPDGFHLGVPQGWRMSRVGELLCFRDPNSTRAISVLDQGRVAGDPRQLIADGETAWRDASDLTGYVRIGLTDVHYDEGAADLEYTYLRDNVVMHGKDRAMRIGGRLFTLSWLTTDFSWSSDRALLDFLQPSFGLDL